MQFVKESAIAAPPAAVATVALPKFRADLETD